MYPKSGSIKSLPSSVPEELLLRRLDVEPSVCPNNLISEGTISGLEDCETLDRSCSSSCNNAVD